MPIYNGSWAYLQWSLGLLGLDMPSPLYCMAGNKPVFGVAGVLQPSGPAICRCAAGEGCFRAATGTNIANPSAILSRCCSLQGDEMCRAIARSQARVSATPLCLPTSLYSASQLDCRQRPHALLATSFSITPCKRKTVAALAFCRHRRHCQNP